MSIWGDVRSELADFKADWPDFKENILPALFMVAIMIAIWAWAYTIYSAYPGEGYYWKVKRLETELAANSKEIIKLEGEVGAGWHLPEIPGYAAQIRYIRHNKL